MKYLMWALVGLLLLAACTSGTPESTQQGGTRAQLLNLQQYQQENSYAFECNTTGFSPHTFLWDFGDGTSRETRHKGVAHTYFKSGTYTVRCTASDDVQNETSTISLDVEIESDGQYEDILGDLDLIDLLSDPMNGTDAPMLNWTHNTTYSPPEEYDDEYDYAFDFEFDEEEPLARRTANTTANNTGKNMTNTTGIGTLLPNTGANATNGTNPNSTNVTNGTGNPPAGNATNSTGGLFEWPTPGNETISPPQIIPEDKPKRKKGAERKDMDDEIAGKIAEEDRAKDEEIAEKDEEIVDVVDEEIVETEQDEEPVVKVKGKRSKALQLSGLKFKVR